MRVNIEEEAWKRIYKMALSSSFSVREITGAVACLWSNSQELVKTHGTREQIIEWSELSKLSTEEVNKWLTELENVRFISIDKNELYKIHGNETQLASIAARISRASKGGKALKKKLSELNKLKAGSKHSTSLLQEAQRGPMQFNAMQFNSKQFNSMHTEAELQKFSTDQIFEFINSFDDSNTVDLLIIKTVAERIEKDIYPMEFKKLSAGAIGLMVKTLKTIDGLKWFYLSARSYADYCVKEDVQKIYGFKKFVEVWPTWVPKKYAEGIQ